MHKSLVVFYSTLIALSPMASIAFFCPSNFNQIDFGMSVDQVTTQCGKPNAQKESKRENENIPQEWSFYVPQTVALSNNSTGQGSLKRLLHLIAKGKQLT